MSVVRAADLPAGTEVDFQGELWRARDHYITRWYFNGCYETDDRMDIMLARGAQVLRIGDGETRD